DGAPPVESGGQQDFADELLSGHRVHDVVALDLAHAVDLERGDVLSVLPIDFRPLRREDLRESPGENLEDAPSVLAARDPFDRLDLCVRCRRIDVDSGHAVASWMAFGHQNAAANFTPSSLLFPDFPLRIL